MRFEFWMIVLLWVGGLISAIFIDSALAVGYLVGSILVFLIWNFAY